MARSEQGFTLLEGLIALFLLSIIALGVTAVFNSLPTYYHRVQSESSANQSVDAALEFMASEIRNAEMIRNDINSRTIVFQTNGQTVTYTQTDNQVVRRVGTQTEVLIDNVSNGQWKIEWFQIPEVVPVTTPPTQANPVGRIRLTVNGKEININPRSVTGVNDGTWYK